MAFKDHFSVLGERYTQFRPRYPRALFEYLATLPAQRGRACDCGTGGGQAAAALAEFFDEVVATDPSKSQIAHAERHAKVRYLVAGAEQVPLEAASVDLVTVAQAVHWFDLARFYAEVKRIARRGAAVALWSYGLARISPEVDRAVWQLYKGILDDYWPPERKTVEQGYRSLPFPFREVEAPPFEMSAEWRLPDLIGYLGTWSSVQQYVRDRATNPVARVESALVAAWGEADAVRRVAWPLFVRAGYVD